MLIEASNEVTYSSPQEMRASYLERRKRLNAGMPKVVKPVVAIPEPEPIPEPVTENVPSFDGALKYSEVLFALVARAISEGLTAEQVAKRINVSVEIVQATAESMLEKTEEAKAKLEQFCNVVDQQHSLDSIMKYACKQFGISKAEMKSPRRFALAVLARQFFFWKAKQLTTKSFPEIARFCGGRDHSTAFYAVKKMDEYVKQGLINEEGVILKPVPSLKSILEHSNKEHKIDCPKALVPLFEKLRGKV